VIHDRASVYLENRRDVGRQSDQDIFDYHLLILESRLFQSQPQPGPSSREIVEQDSGGETATQGVRALGLLPAQGIPGALGQLDHA
jgi:hypothetical protein